jgi:cell wall assembly regulator SMI1
MGRVVMIIRDSWARIEAWLAAWAPYVLASLNPGASPEAVQSAEAALGVDRLPEDFVQSWLIHDGQNWNDRPQLILGYSLMPLRRIVELRADWQDLAASGAFDEVRAVARGPVRPEWWNGHWVPIGVNGVGDMVCLDLDPPSGGAFGQVIEVLHEEELRTVLARSLGAWLDEFVLQLENEGYLPSYESFYGLVHVRDLPY